MPVNPDLLGGGTPRRRKIVSEGGSSPGQTGSPSSPLSLAQGRVLVPRREEATSAPARRRIITNANQEGVLGLTSIEEPDRPWLDRPSEVEQEAETLTATREAEEQYDRELAAAERLAAAAAGELEGDLVNDSDWEEVARLIARFQLVKEQGDLSDEDKAAISEYQNQLWNIYPERIDDELIPIAGEDLRDKWKEEVYQKPEGPSGWQALGNLFGDATALLGLPQQETWSKVKDLVRGGRAALGGDFGEAARIAAGSAARSALQGKAAIEGSTPAQLYNYSQGDGVDTPVMDVLQSTMAADDRDASGWRSFDELLGVEWAGPHIPGTGLLPGDGFDLRNVTNAAAELMLDPLNLVGAGPARGAGKGLRPVLERGATRMAARAAEEGASNRMSRDAYLKMFESVWTKYRAGGMRALSEEEKVLMRQLVVEGTAASFVDREVRRSGRRLADSTINKLRDRVDDVRGRTLQMLEELDDEAIQALGANRDEILNQAARRLANMERGPGGFRIAGQSLTGGAPVFNRGARAAAAGADDFNLEVFNRISGREGGKALTDEEFQALERQVKKAKKTYERLTARNERTPVKNLTDEMVEEAGEAYNIAAALEEARDEITELIKWAAGDSQRLIDNSILAPMERMIRKLSPRRVLRTAGRLQDEGWSLKAMPEGTDDAFYGAVSNATASAHWIGKSLRAIGRSKQRWADALYPQIRKKKQRLAMFDEVVADILTGNRMKAEYRMNRWRDQAATLREAGETARATEIDGIVDFLETLDVHRNRLTREFRDWGFHVAQTTDESIVPTAPTLSGGSSGGGMLTAGATKMQTNYVPRFIDQEVARNLENALAKIPVDKRNFVLDQIPELKNIFELGRKKGKMEGGRLGQVMAEPSRVFGGTESNPYRLNEKVAELLEPMRADFERLGVDFDELTQLYKTDVATNLALHYEQAAQRLSVLNVLDAVAEMPGRGGRGKLAYFHARPGHAKRQAPWTAKRQMKMDGVDPAHYIDVQLTDEVTATVDRAIVAELEDTMKLLTNKEVREGFVGFVDELGKLFAATATVLPTKGFGFFSRNELGNILNGWLRGLRNPAYYTQGWDLVGPGTGATYGGRRGSLDWQIRQIEQRSGRTWWQAAQELAGEDPDWARVVRAKFGQDVDPADLNYNAYFRKWARGELNLSRRSKLAEDLHAIRMALDTGAVTDRTFVDDIVGGRDYTGQRRGRMRQANILLTEGPSEEAKLDTPLKAAAQRVTSAPIRAGRTISSTLENNARMAMFLKQLDEGMSPEEAAQEVFRTFFDYQDLTGTEQLARSYGMRFYTFTRKNLVLHLTTLLQHPGRAAQVAKIERGVEQYLGETVLGGVLGLRPPESEGMGQRDELNYYGSDVGFVGLDTPQAQAYGTFTLGSEAIADILGAFGLDAHIPLLTTDEDFQSYIGRVNSLFSGPLPAIIEEAYAQRVGVDPYGLYPIEEQTAFETFVRLLGTVLPGVQGTERNLERLGVNPRNYGVDEGERVADSLESYLLWNLGVGQASWNTNNEIWADKELIRYLQGELYDFASEAGIEDMDMYTMLDEGFLDPRQIVMAVASGGLDQDELTDLFGGQERYEAVTGLSPWSTGGVIESESKRKADAQRAARDFIEAFEYEFGRKPNEREYSLWLINDPELNYGELEGAGYEPDRPNQLLPGASVNTDTPPDLVVQQLGWYEEALGLETGWLKQVRPVLNEVDRIVADAQELGWSDDEIAQYFMTEWFSRTDRYQIEEYFPEAPDVPDGEYSSLETDAERSDELDSFILDKLALERVLGRPISGAAALEWARAMTMNVTDQRLSSGGYLTPSGSARGGVRSSVSVPRRPDTASFDERYLNADLNSQVAEYGVLGQLPDWYLYEPQREAQEQFEPGSVLGPLPQLGVYD